MLERATAGFERRRLSSIIKSNEIAQGTLNASNRARGPRYNMSRPDRNVSIGGGNVQC